MFDNKE